MFKPIPKDHNQKPTKRVMFLVERANGDRYRCIGRYHKFRPKREVSNTYVHQSENQIYVQDYEDIPFDDNVIGFVELPNINDIANKTIV